LPEVQCSYLIFKPTAILETTGCLQLLPLQLCADNFCMFDTFSESLPVSTFLLPSHHVPSSTSLSCFVGYKWYQCDIKCNASYVWTHKCFIHVLHCKHEIYSVRFSYVILHASDLWYGAIIQHRLTTNSVGLTREHS